MSTTDLNAQFGIPNVLHFDEFNGLTRAQVTLPTCAATVYLHGAHVTHWQPTGDAPVFFVSSRSALEPGKPIRGGVPICFPWFATRSDGKPGPGHGFARLEEWTLASAALMPADHTLHLTFTLAASDQARSFGFDNFRLAYEVILGADHGRALTLRFSVANLADTPFAFEEALHTYFHIADIHKVEITGLESAPYIDKVDDFKQKTSPPSPLKITTRTDRVFPNASGPATIHDDGNHRIITNTKTNSDTSVVWNPWSETILTMPDLAPDDWLSYVCVETANAGVNAVTLPAKQARTMQTTISIHPA
jgi:glucose-6-phosphate 1-epimerase